MRKLKILSALISAAMCVSMVSAPVMVLADEDDVPEETQAVEETEKPAPKETEKQKPAETEKEEPEETKKQEPAETQKEEPSETEKAEPEEKETEEKEPEITEEAPLENEDSDEALNALGSGKCGKKLKWTLSDKYVLKITGTGAMYNYGKYDSENPAPWSKWSGYSLKIVVSKGVTTIGSYAFNRCWYIESISLPSTLKTINAHAFEGCGVMHISIPKGVTKICDYAFNECGDLLNVTIPSTVTTIGKYAFKYCSLITLIIPKGVKVIDEQAFACNYYLKSVSISKSVTTIGKEAFIYCNLSDFKMGSGVKTIGDGAFYGTHLYEITIPSGVTKLGESVFANCYYLESVKLPKTLKSIGKHAFYDCEYGLEKISIPESVTSIGEGAFADCGKLTTVDIPVSGLISIGPKAFYWCKSLTGFKMPLSVTSVGELAFKNCTELNEVWISKTQEGNLPSDAFEDCTKLNFVYHDYPLIGNQFSAGFISYAIADPDIDGTGTVDILGFDKDAERIVIPSVVEYSGVKYKVAKITRWTSQYNNALALKILVIGPNVTSIQDDALSGCPELVSVTGGSGLKTIGARAFANCPKLKVFNISSKTLSKISALAFSGDKALKTLQVKKTTKLTKSGVKNSLKGSSVKTVKVKKSKVKKYKKFFKKKNCGKKVKVKK